MSIKCTIHPSKLSGNYKSGEVVEGLVNLSIPVAVEVNDINIGLLGVGFVSWRERAANRNHPTDASGNIRYESEDYYAFERDVLLRRAYLPRARHIFEFSLQLPEECPGSFASTYGTIRYYIKLLLTTAEGKVEMFKHDIWVDKEENLNFYPPYKLPVQVEEIMTFCWLACTNGPILITLNTPFGAYVPLQKLHYTMRIENQSMYDVAGYVIWILQKTTYTATKPDIKKRCEITNFLNKKIDDKCLRLTTRLLEHYIEIPDVPPSTGIDNDNSIISIQYELKVKVLLSDWSQHCELTMPLHLGSIPLIESVETEPEAPSQPILPPPADANDSLLSHENTQPPSFSDAIRSNLPPSFETAVRYSSLPFESMEN